MIGLNIVLIIVALVVAFFLFFKLLKSGIKALMFILFLTLFVVGVLGFLVYLDVNKVKGSFEKGQTALLLHDGTIVAGFTYSDNPGEVLQSDKFRLLDKETLSEIDSSIKSKTYSEDTLTIVVASDYFVDKYVDLMDGQKLLLDEDTLSSVFGCKEMNECTKPLIAAAPSLKKQIASSFEDEQDLKNKLFFNIFTQETKGSKGGFVISGIRSEKIVVYPALTTLKLIKFIPQKTITKATDKISLLVTDNTNSTTNINNTN
jgi:hypothetical protein